MSGAGYWDPAGLANAFSTMQLTPPPSGEWYMDSGVSSQMAFDTGTLFVSHLSSRSTPSHIVVGNSSLLPVTATGSTALPYARPLSL